MKDLFGNVVVGDILRGRYKEPPFSVLDTRTASWIKRRRLWLELGIKSEIGRHSTVYNTDESLCKKEKMVLAKRKGTSIFDPTLCELMYNWFCPKSGHILDPFAGGSVRGIIACCLGFKYAGIELRKEQVESNVKQAETIIKGDNKPFWIVGDAETELKKLCTNYDFVFSCPPYMDLEVYSDLPMDLSNMCDSDFISKYNRIIRIVCNLLKAGKFAVFVVGDVRNKKGYYKDFITITKRAFRKSGLMLWNDLILLNSVGSAALRARKQFDNSRKIVKVHQNVLVFKKPRE